MKQSNNNEVDLLLRSLASREQPEPPPPFGSASADANRIVSDHLDIDEMNSYAEGVAPAPARARYVEHLADCDRCRRIVSSLTQSAGIRTQYDLPEQQRAGSWQKLVTLFSPPVLRYGIPAVVLTGVIGISLLALRQPRRPEFVAQNQPNSAVTSTAPSQTGLGSSNPAPSRQEQVTNSAGNVDSNLQKKTLQEGKSGAAPTPALSRDNASANSPAKNLAQPGEPSSVAGLAPGVAAPPPPPRPAFGEEQGATTAKEQPTEREVQQVRSREESRDQADNASGPNRSSSKTAVAPMATRRIAGLAGGRVGPQVKDKKESSDEAETRTVSGRRFRRDGEVWVDTAYESQATINVARGSEQFRALVADEPGIRMIAQQLGGEVVVVWKGKAYRIH